jgi:hypothetical protein
VAATQLSKVTLIGVTYMHRAVTVLMVEGGPVATTQLLLNAHCVKCKYVIVPAAAAAPVGSMN